MAGKRVIDGIDGLRRLAGQDLFVSAPVEVTKERIQDFCRSVDNDEWIHWDDERCRNSPLGAIIAPAMYVPALFPKVFWEHVEIVGIPDMLLLGSDRLRLLRPVKAGDQVTVSARLDRVEDRHRGVAGFYDATFNLADGNDQPAAVATFIVRYW